MKLKKIFFLIAAFIIGFTKPSFGEAEVLFEAGAGARPMGLGGAFVAVSDNTDALFYNPAGLSNIRKASFSSMYSKMFNETTFINASFAYPIVGDAAIGAGILRNSIDGINQLDNAGNLIGTFSYSSQAVYISFSKRLNEKFSSGLNTNLISQSLPSGFHQGFGMDIGALYEINKFLKFGLSVKNINQPKLGLDTIVRSIHAGLSINPLKNVMFSSQIDIKSNRGARVRFGGEWLVLPQFCLRGGHDSSTYYLGTSLALGPVSFDYSFNPHELGDINRFSLKF